MSAGDIPPRHGPVRSGLLRALAPIQAFFRLEAASSLLLLLGAVVALLWANSPWGPWHQALFGHPFQLGGHEVNLLDVIDEGLMALFFFLVGLEIKRELAIGELRTASAALLPLIAAVGGMVVPALIYFAFTHGTEAARGWGIPMATDIAFSLGVLTALKGRIPNSLIAFLTALAIFDDLGGILVIAFFYGTGFHFGALGISAVLILALAVLHRWKFAPVWLYLPIGVALWVFLGQAGIHATLAGVAVGLLVPIQDRTGRPVLERWERALHPYVAYGVIPLFALANAGVSLAGLSAADLVAPVTLGVTLGLLLGKPLGIGLATFGAVAAKISPLPRESSKSQVIGVAATGGIGFTVALFIAELAFTQHPQELEEAKLGILVGSAAAAVVGFLLLRASSRPSPERAVA
jgi:NhaA family Na+:H+ antiporter